MERAPLELGESISSLVADYLRRQLKAREKSWAKYEYKSVQIHSPEQPAIPHYLELIFEREPTANV